MCVCVCVCACVHVCRILYAWECSVCFSRAVHGITISHLTPTVHGNWSVWSQWSECSTTCGTGTQDRERECNNPAPQYGGDNCTGVSAETRSCLDLPPCPVDCKWNEWSNWTECSLSCDNGTQIRSRTFEPALHGGNECEGPEVESELCNTQACPGKAYITT